MGRGKIHSCMTAPFVFNKQVCYMKKRLQFGKEKKQIDYDLIRNIGIWAFKVILVCLLALVIVFYFGRQVKNSGDSMRPAVLDGDIVLVNRMIYDASKPKRGDIIVFKPNGNENARSYIKRIIGLPGETVQIKDKEIYINGEKLEEDYETTAIEEAGTAAEEITLDGDEYFVLGDNRRNSEDSRMADIGNVKRSEIEGKAWFVLSTKGNFGFI